MKTENMELSGLTVVKRLLIILAVLVLALSVYGYIRTIGFNQELSSMGMSRMSVDDLIEQTAQIERYTGRSFYDEVGGISRLTVLLISGRRTLLLIGLAMLAGAWIIGRVQPGYPEQKSERLLKSEERKEAGTWMKL